MQVPFFSIVVSTLLLLLFDSPFCLAALPCSTDFECSSQLREGSFCIDGFCSNPFIHGCLKTLKPSHTSGRTCNSDDKRVGTLGKTEGSFYEYSSSSDCTNYNTELQYPEIRIHNGDWESSIFFAWILQILLMEVLHIPATVGLTTESTPATSFYSPINTLEYSSASYPFEALRNSNDGPCHETNEECVHVLPEVWNGQANEWMAALDGGYIEPVHGNGQVGKMSWYVPAFTVDKDSTLASFYGLKGEQNRHKLAELFLKPTTWKEYCEYISKDNCTTPDAVASHYPPKEDEEKYFSDPSLFVSSISSSQQLPPFLPSSPYHRHGYIGHFRKTPENNCTDFPDACFGHFIAPPCSWSTNVDSQLHWNDIKLKPDGPLEPNGGYSYASMIEIWRAANATKSNVMMWWWSPEALTEEFYGTDAQFQQVLLPKATYKCAQARVDARARCSPNITERRGDPLGSCDQEAHALRKIISTALADSAKATSEVERSPAFDLIKAAEITDLEMDRILRDWIGRKIDPYGNDAREAVCGWVVENINSLMDFVPGGFPKNLSKKSGYQTKFMYGVTALAVVATLIVLVMASLAIRWRKAKVFVFAQAHMVYLIMFGFFLIAVAAILTSLEPTDINCIAQSWLVTLGYTIELVPLLVKISAINKILTSAKKMKRVEIPRSRMLHDVGLVIGFISTGLIVWTIVDPPQRVEELVLKESEMKVEISLKCSSNHELWFVGTLAWQGLLLLAAAVLAFQSRDIVQEFNESRSLGTMIYSHVLFIILRGIAYNLEQNKILLPHVVAGATSVLLSLDTLLALGLYLAPKCLQARLQPASYNINERPGLGRLHSSCIVSEIETRAAAAQLAHFNSGSMTHITDTFSNSLRTISSTKKDSSLNLVKAKKRISDIKEVSVEESDVDAHFCKHSETESRSSDAASPPIPILAETASCPTADACHTQRGLSRPESKSKKDLSLRLSRLHLGSECGNPEVDDSDDESDYDSGGPRYTSAKHNKELEKSIRMRSAPEFNYTHDGWENIRDVAPVRHSSFFGAVVSAQSLNLSSSLRSLNLEPLNELEECEEEEEASKTSHASVTENGDV